MRASGILMPISSLPSPYGIGTMGAAARSFCGLFGQVRAGILADSSPSAPQATATVPYQSFSTFAGNPYFIDLETLIEDELLTKKSVTRQISERMKKKSIMKKYIMQDLKY